MNPGAVADSIGWGTLLTFGLSILMGALSYGASNQRNNRTSRDVEDLKKDHGEQLKATRDVADKAHTALSDYKLLATEKFVSVPVLNATEARLTTAINGAKEDMASKVDEIKTELGKKQIGHTVQNAVAAALAQHTLAAKGKAPQ